MFQNSSEVTYGNSRFDLACLKGGEYAYYEVKSVNLVVNQIAVFPDAPTERGSKHLAELLRAHQEGYHTGVIFVVQRNDAKSFQPNKNGSKFHVYWVNVIVWE